MRFKVNSSKFKVQGSRLRLNSEHLKARLKMRKLFSLSFFASLRLCGIIFLLLSPSLAQNDLSKIEDGGFVKNWLISSALPAEIDAGAWENFNRFNIENLPQKDWLAPFGGLRNIKPSVGKFKATIETQTSEKPKSKIQNPKFG